jgi:hypothetical protein
MPDDDSGAGGSLPIQLRIAQALKVRTRIPMAAEADAAQPLFPAAQWQVALENIGLDGMYRVLLIAVMDDEVKVLTNFRLRAGEPPYLDRPGSALDASLTTSQHLADTIAARLARLQFTDGLGGLPDAHDGAVHFLTISSATETKTTALYFYQYPATSRRFNKPDGVDGPRWDAVHGIYELWREIVANPVVGSR